MRILGIDYGNKRIGIAIGEPDVNMAFSRELVNSCGSIKNDSVLIAQIAKSENCDLIVIGLPLLPSGEEGTQSQIAKSLGHEIEQMGHKVQYFDERYTTSQASANLSHLNSKKRKQLEDSEAARIMLQQFLESQ